MSEAEQNGFKRWEDLDITDDFIFTRVTRNKRLYLNIILMAASQLPLLPGVLGAGSPQAVLGEGVVLGGETHRF